MKTRLAMKICAGLILGSVLSTIPVASAECTMYDEIKALHQRGMSSGDMYDAWSLPLPDPRARSAPT